MKRIAVKVKYLDTSAIVKLFLDEDGSDNIRTYYNSHINFCCAEMTFYEAMNVLKSRLFKGDKKDQYFENIRKLRIMGWGWFTGKGKLEIETVQLNNVDVFKEVYDYAMTYDIDIADAIQIYALLRGKYSVLTGDSMTVLITADEKLEKAAMDNNIRVWNCRKGNKPDWLDN
jgi:predicted nucleic acid-binding protein